MKDNNLNYYLSLKKLFFNKYLLFKQKQLNYQFFIRNDVS